MGYEGSPPYVQRQTDQMLRPFRHYARAYFDDIIIFSHTLDEHLKVLSSVLELFRDECVSLAPNKSFLEYPSIRLLDQRADGLGLSTTEEKLNTIAKLALLILFMILITFSK